MIHLTSITRQHGSQILFRNASLQILPGTRTGLVGANGAGYRPLQSSCNCFFEHSVLKETVKRDLLRRRLHATIAHFLEL